MGFYGNLSNSARTQLHFDRIYSNRKEMDDNIASDGVFVGRYVLVEYGHDTPRDGYLSVAAIEDAAEEGAYYAYMSPEKVDGTKILLALEDDSKDSEALAAIIEAKKLEYEAAINRKRDLAEIISSYEVSIKNYSDEKDRLQARHDEIILNGSNTSPTTQEKLNIYQNAEATIEQQSTVIRLQEAVIEECTNILNSNPDDANAKAQLESAILAKQAAEDRKATAEHQKLLYQAELAELLNIINEIENVDITLRNQGEIYVAYSQQLVATETQIEELSAEILILQNEYNASLGTAGLVVKIDDRIYFADGLTGKDCFYICIGKDEQGYALFKMITSNTNDQYMTNYNIDRLAYGSDQSYDSTVWRKSFSKEKEVYIMIAELNTKTPAFGLTIDAPTMNPVPPHFGTDSTNLQYNLHVQPSWGMRIKNAELDETSDDTKTKSDEVVIRTKTTYDNNTGTMYHVNENINGAIYYNKAGFGQDVSAHEKDIIDTISILPTGKSGKDYNSHIGDIEDTKKPDIYEVSIMLPSIGNAIANMYDTIYGVNPKNDNKRYLDIEWKDVEDKYLKTGSPDLGGATRDVSTLAGTINHTHDLMGMIITNRDTELTQEEIDEADSNKIYHYNNNYYIKHETYDYEQVEYEFEEIELNEYSYAPYSYYIFNNGEYEMSTGEFDSDQTYYEKIFNGSLDPINLLQYEPDTYYYQDSQLNLILDTDPTFDAYSTYYSFTAEETPLTNYKPYTYYTLENGSYYLSIEETFDKSAAYFSLTDFDVVDKPFYQKGVYYYVNEEDGKAYLDVNEDFTKDRDYYTQVTGHIDIDPDSGEIISSAEVVVDSKIELIGFKYNTYYSLVALDYIVLNNVKDYDPKQTYYTFKKTLFSGTFYEADYFYYKNGNDYMIDTSAQRIPDRTYYIVSDLTPLDLFYEPNVYYYENEYGLYEIDVADRITLDRQYYIRHKYYIIKDILNKFMIGSEWNQNIYSVPASIEIGDRTPRAEMIPLLGYGDDLHTINGLIVSLNQLLERNDTLTRKRETIQGTLNLLNDKLNQFEAFLPGALLVTDIYGRVNTVAASEDTWIQVDINPYALRPEIHYSHKDANSDHLSTSITGDETPNFGVTFKIPEIRYDLKGHIYDTKTHTVKIPLPSLTDAEFNQADVITQLALTPATGALQTTRTNIGDLLITGYTKASSKTTLVATDSLNTALGKLEKNIEQEVADREAAINALDYTDSSANTTQFVSKVTEQDGMITVERANAGSLLITGYTKASAKATLSATDNLNTALGKLEKNIEQEESDRKAAINALDYSDSSANITQFVSKVTETDGIITVERSNAGSLLITGYAKASTKATLTANDTLNTALGKLEKNIEQEVADRQSAINALDYTDSDANTTQFISKVTEANGVISVERSNAGGLILTGYSAGSSGEVAATDSINTAFSKVQTQISTLKTNVQTSGTGLLDRVTTLENSDFATITQTDIDNWNNAEQNVQSDWNVTSTSSDAYIKNKPDLSTMIKQETTFEYTYNGTTSQKTIADLFNYIATLEARIKTLESK